MRPSAVFLCFAMMGILSATMPALAEESFHFLYDFGECG